MKKLILGIIFLSFSFMQAQVNFENGYYIDNENNRQDGFIENAEWLDNPYKFKYKKSLQDKSIEVDISQAKEFGFTNSFVYTRATVDIDKSSSTKNISDSRMPIFEEETLFLKRVIEGKASLYSFIGFGVQRYFFSLDNTISTEQLIYKKYQISSSQGFNERFKQQLNQAFDCSNFTEKTFQDLKYKKSDLSSLFKRYNECNGSESIEYSQIAKSSLGERKIKLKAKAGVRSNFFTFRDNTTEVNFSNQIVFTGGIESEFIFNFNRNKWSAIVDAVYFSYNAEESALLSGFNRQDLSIEYSAIDLSAGARYSFFLNNSNRVFINALYTFPINIRESFRTTLSQPTEDFLNGAAVNFGGGFEYKNYSLELRYLIPRSLINGQDADYSALSLTFAYTIF